MKYLRMFESASGLFPKRIKITLIDATTGNSIGKYKIPAEMLPSAFNRPITLEIGNNSWRVLKADPVLADDFLFTKKLVLEVLNASSIDAEKLGFHLPTTCGNLPVIGTDSMYGDFTVELIESDWRQIEFVPLTQSVVVGDAIKKIEVLLNNQPNPLLGYEQRFIRNNELYEELAIPWEEFCGLLSNPVGGNVFLDKKGFVQQGFSIKSDSYTYYGILENGTIRSLCLQQLEWVDDEFMRILSTFELCLVDWCNGSRISAEAGDEPKSEFVRL